MSPELFNGLRFCVAYIFELYKISVLIARSYQNKAGVNCYVHKKILAAYMPDGLRFSGLFYFQFIIGWVEKSYCLAYIISVSIFHRGLNFISSVRLFFYSEV